MPKIKVMGVEFQDKKDAIHWVQVGLRLQNNPTTKRRLLQELVKLKGTKSK
jgi:hypothetical protein